MNANSIRSLAAAALSLGLMAGLPASAATGDLFPLAKPVAVKSATMPDAGTDMARRGRGADDGPGHVRGGGKKRGRGADDGPNHT